MRRIAIILSIAIMAVTSLNIAARAEQTSQKAIQFEKLVEMLANDAHWDNQNLINIGLQELIFETVEDEEAGDFYYFVYGTNVTAQHNEDYGVNLTETGPHAFAIEITLMTDNGTNLYFKQKGDHDEFLRCVRQSSSYVNNNGLEYIGISLIESDEFVNDWYVISFHGG